MAACECGGCHDHFGEGACGGQPGDGFTDTARVDVIADRDDVSGCLEAGHEGTRHGEVAVPDHGVAPLDPRVGDADRHLTGTGRGLVEFCDAVVVFGVEKDSPHSYSPLR